MNDSPSPNGPNGRDAGGRFAKGNPGGPGNPHAQQVSELRSALLSAVSTDDLLAVIKALVQKAQDGDVPATKLLLDRLLGPIDALDVLARLDALDESVAHLLERKGSR